MMRSLFEKPKIPEIKLNAKLDMSSVNEGLKRCNEAFEKILANSRFLEFERMAKDIQDMQDKEMALEFTKVISELLKSNGVVPKITECKAESVSHNSIECRYGVSIEGLDFTEHDKVFEDRISESDRMRKSWMDKAIEWEKKCDQLEQRLTELEAQDYAGACETIEKLNTTIDVLMNRLNKQ